MVVSLICWLLKRKTLSTEERAILTNEILAKIDALPIADVVEFDIAGNLFLNKRKLDVEQIISLRSSASALKDSFARKVVNEQLKYLAVKIGVHEGMTTDQILFCKAMLYCLQEEEKLIGKLVMEDGIIE